MEQLINAAVLIVAIACSLRDQPVGPPKNLYLVGMGVCLLVAQVVLNRLFGRMDGTSISTADALLLKEVSYSCGLALLGYLVILLGVFDGFRWKSSRHRSGK